MKFLVDAQLPPALATWLNEQSYQAWHVENVGLRAASDRAIWDYALAQELIVITKDEDFAACSVLAAISPVIVWLRISNATNHALLLWLQPRWNNIQILLAAGQRLIEVR